MWCHNRRHNLWCFLNYKFRSGSTQLGCLSIYNWSAQTNTPFSPVHAILVFLWLLPFALLAQKKIRLYFCFFDFSPNTVRLVHSSSTQMYPTEQKRICIRGRHTTECSWIKRNIDRPHDFSTSCVFIVWNSTFKFDLILYGLCGCLGRHTTYNNAHLLFSTHSDLTPYFKLRQMTYNCESFASIVKWTPWYSVWRSSQTLLCVFPWSPLIIEGVRWWRALQPAVLQQRGCQFRKKNAQKNTKPTQSLFVHM